MARHVRWLLVLCGLVLAAPLAAQAPVCPLVTGYIAPSDAARDTFVAAVAAVRPAGPTGDLVRLSPERGVLRVKNWGVLRRLMEDTYPIALRNARQGGKVRFLVRVDTDGKVAELYMVEGDPEPAFNEGAVRAAREIVFHPIVVDGCPITFWYVIELTYQPA